MADDSAELAVALRRVERLEAALAVRIEALEACRAEAVARSAARVVGPKTFVKWLAARLLPRGTRRGAALAAAVRFSRRVANRLRKGRKPNEGAPPPDRYRNECAPPDEYGRWIARHEPAPAEVARQCGHAFARSPKVSVVVPVFDPPAEYLAAAIRSVREQTYANWELCLADGASTAPAVRAILEAATAADPRVRVAYLPANAGIVGNSNAALALATGEFVALLDHDDELAPSALHEVVAAVDAHPGADFLYSDEDKLDRHGRRVEPHFKPEWSPETLRSRNYVCHLVVLRRSLLDEIGGFRPGYDGAQDHDLVLRAGERARRIVRIPRVLYHWRMHARSTAARAGSKGYAFEAGKRAVADHLRRLGVEASVCGGGIPGTYRAVYRPRARPLVSVVVPNRDSAGMLARCLDSLSRSSYDRFEVLVAENGSVQPETHAYYRELAKRPNVRVVEWARPFNYAAINNFAAAQAKGELLLFLNNDTEAINPDWLAAMVGLAVQPGVGAVGAKLYYADDTVQHAGMVIGMDGTAGHAHRAFPRRAAGHMQRLRYTQNVAAVTGACLMTPREVFEEVGGFDEAFVVTFNDVDLCLSVLARGYRVVWTPDAELYHLECKTRGLDDTDEKRERFRREYELFRAKWRAFIDGGDPYFSPHFRLDRSDFALKAA